MSAPQIELALTSTGRQLFFSKELREVAHVFRRVGGEAAPWQRLAVNARSPFLDEDAFAPGTLLEYYVQRETQQGQADARSPVVSTPLP